MAQDEAKLFVRGLADSITDGILRQIFEETGGTVVHVSVPKDRETGRPRGIAFVTMGTAEQAKVARESLDGSIHGGRSISVRPYEALPPRREERGPNSSGPGSVGPGSVGPRSTRDMGQDRTLYVGNLPYEVAQTDIEELIGQHVPNAIQRVHLPVGPDGRRRGFGFVTMASVEAAKAALDGLQGADLAGRKLIINLAQPKADRPPRPDGFSGGGGGGGGGAPFAPPPPPPGPASRRFDNHRKKANSGSFDDGGPPRRGGSTAGKKGRDRDQDDWRKAVDDKDDKDE